MTPTKKVLAAVGATAAIFIGTKVLKKVVRKRAKKLHSDAIIRASINKTRANLRELRESQTRALRSYR